MVFSTLACKARHSSRLLKAYFTSWRQQFNPATEGREHYIHLRYKPENSALPGTNDVIRSFNRDTGWLASGVLGAVVFAAFVLAVLVQERHPKAADPTEE